MDLVSWIASVLFILAHLKMTNKTGKQAHRNVRKLANRKNTELSKMRDYIRRLEQERADLAPEWNLIASMFFFRIKNSIF